MNELMALIEAHPELKEKIETLGTSGQKSINADDIIALAQEMGIDTSSLTDVAEGELSEDELLAVSGGQSIRLCRGAGLVINF